MRFWAEEVFAMECGQLACRRLLLNFTDFLRLPDGVSRGDTGSAEGRGEKELTRLFAGSVGVSASIVLCALAGYEFFRASASPRELFCSPSGD